MLEVHRLDMWKHRKAYWRSSTPEFVMGCGSWRGLEGNVMLRLCSKMALKAVSSSLPGVPGCVLVGYTLLFFCTMTFSVQLVCYFLFLHGKRVPVSFYILFLHDDFECQLVFAFFFAW